MISFSLPHFNRQRVARGGHPDAAATTDFATLLSRLSFPSNRFVARIARVRVHAIAHISPSTRTIPSYYTHARVSTLKRKVNPVSRIESEHVEQPSPRDGFHRQQRPPPHHARSTVPPLGVIDEPKRRRSLHRDHGGFGHARGRVSRAHLHLRVLHRAWSDSAFRETRVRDGAHLGHTRTPAPHVIGCTRIRSHECQSPMKNL